MAHWLMYVGTYVGLKPDEMTGHEGEVLIERLRDEETMDSFDAKVMLSQTPQEGYEELELRGEKGDRVPGKWYVKILEKLGGVGGVEEEVITVFESKKLGDRRGYMLKSMMTEQKGERKKEIMTTELEERLKRKKEIVEELRKKQK